MPVNSDVRKSRSMLLEERDPGANPLRQRYLRLGTVGCTLDASDPHTQTGPGSRDSSLPRFTSNRRAFMFLKPGGSSVVGSALVPAF